MRLDRASPLACLRFALLGGEDPLLGR